MMHTNFTKCTFLHFSFVCMDYDKQLNNKGEGQQSSEVLSSIQVHFTQLIR